GLRYDLLLHTVSAHNTYSWVDPTAPNPALGGFPGTVVFATPNRRTGARTFTRGLGPRIGIAYSLNDKTVIRTGYGILYTTGGAQRGTRGLYLQGFNSVNIQPIVNGGLDPAFTFAAGWPASNIPAPPFIDPRYGFNSGPHPIYSGDGRGPDIQNWNFAIQRQLPGQVLLDVGYVGTKGTHLVSRVLPTNVMPTHFMTDPAFVYDCLDAQGKPAKCNYLVSKIADPAVQALSVVQAMPVDPATGDHSPFSGFQALTGPIGAATLGQALRPFPQYQQESNSQMRRWSEGVGVPSYHS